MAPRGRVGAPVGRETRSSAMKSKTAKTTRGGIQKRGRASTRADGDGDLDMDSAGARAKKNTPADSNTTRTRPSTRAATSLNAKGPSRTAQNVLKHLTNGSASSLASRVSGAASGKGKGKGRQQDMSGLSVLRVGGLKQSKAASNPGGGLDDLLAFMERKASSFLTGRHKRNIAIKKVCY